MTREEAIQVLQEKIDNRPLFKDEREAFMVAIEALSAEPKWIPCSEKLPSEDKCGWYLVTVKGHELFVDIAPFNDELWKRLDSHQKALAWMPLPKPYKGGDDE